MSVDNDGTTTRYGNKIAMAHGIDLHSKEATSMLRHKSHRKRVVNIVWLVLGVGLVVWAWWTAWRYLQW